MSRMGAVTDSVGYLQTLTGGADVVAIAAEGDVPPQGHDGKHIISTTYRHINDFMFIFLSHIFMSPLIPCGP